MKVDWFKRRWIIQELVLGNRPYFRRGRETMNWTDFRDAISLFVTMQESIRHAFTDGQQTYEQSRNFDMNLIYVLDVRALPANNLFSITEDLVENSARQKRLLSLEQLVSSRLFGFEAGDPRGTVFAALQLAKDSSVPDGSEERQIYKWRKPIFQLGILVFSSIAMLWYTVFATKPTQFSIPKESSVSANGARSTLLSIPSSAQWAINSSIWATLWLVSLFVFENIRALLASRSGGVGKAIDKRIESNYDKDIIDVYADFIDYCVETSNSLNIICRHWASLPINIHGRKTDIPSWILPLDGHPYGGSRGPFQIRSSGDSLVGSEGSSHYSASGALPPKYTLGKNKQALWGFAKTAIPYFKEIDTRRSDGTLTVEGFVLGYIQESSQIIAGLMNQKSLRILGLQPGVPMPDQIWQTLVANKGPGGTRPPNWYRRACKACLEWYENQNQPSFNLNVLLRLPGTPKIMVEFLDRVLQVIWERKCFRATMKDGKELVGLAPPNAEFGDMVCIIFGCSVPVVLKKTGKDFKFVGECYVHGMMDGEAVDPIPKYISKQHFRLR